MRNTVILAALAATPILASPLSAAPVVSAGPLAGAAPQRVQVRTTDDLTLAGDYYAPPKKGTAPTALLVHDAGADRTQLSKVAERLQKYGFAVLTIDLRGHGESKGENLDWAGLTEAERSATWTFSTRDLEAGADWLRKQDGIHRTNLSLVGAGSGCALAVRHASRDENVRCVTLLGPRTDNFGFDVASDIHEIEGLPTLIVAGREDVATEKMVREANAGNGGFSYIDLEYTSNAAEDALADRSTPKKVATWIKDCAVPKKGG